jgi:leucyl/phenylalanyl-tRNA--protein transferase
LHTLGFAESWEAWSDEALVGGIYAVVLNRAAFLESTFHYADNAGKVALVSLYESLCAEGVTLFDFQVPSVLAKTFGARTVSRRTFENLLHEAIH